MPVRQTPLVTGEYYHLFNRSIYQQPIFRGRRNSDRFLEIFIYYTQTKPPTKFSYYKKNKNKYRLDFKNRLITIVAYCIMPNHFHLLVRQEKDKGIRSFLQKTLNAYAHYFNLKHNHKGPVFEAPFQAIRIATEEQLLHLSRYIHLNPVTDYLVENPQDYEFSSCNLFLEKNTQPSFDPAGVLSFFKNSQDYLDFVMARKDYQRELKKIKHLLME